MLISAGSLNENTILSLAKANGLDVNKLKKDMNSKTVKDTIQSNYAIAKQLGIAGTPAFFIGNTNAQKTEDVDFVLGEMSRSEIQTAIQKSRS